MKRSVRFPQSGHRPWALRPGPMNSFLIYSVFSNNQLHNSSPNYIDFFVFLVHYKKRLDSSNLEEGVTFYVLQG